MDRAGSQNEKAHHSHRNNCGGSFWPSFDPGFPKPWQTTEPCAIRPVTVGFADKHDSFAWLGVPFAQPPVGPLRWRAPRPAAPWQDHAPGAGASARPARSWTRSRCSNKHAMSGSEDCLYLNIWSPRTGGEIA